MATEHEFRPTWAAWFWMLVLSLGLLTPYVWWRRRGVRYEIRDGRAIRYTGRLSTSVEEIRIADVSRMETHRSFGEKILGGGSITLDTGVDEMTLSAVPDPDGVINTVRAYQS